MCVCVRERGTGGERGGDCESSHMHIHINTHI